MQNKQVISYVLIILGTFVSDWGIAGFLVPNHFIDGGVTGICMLLAKFLGLPLAILIAVVNLPFVALGLKHIGVQFAVKSTIAIFLLAMWLLVIPFPQVTQDKSAFIVIAPVHEVNGGVVKQRNFH